MGIAHTLILSSKTDHSVYGTRNALRFYVLVHVLQRFCNSSMPSLHAVHSYNILHEGCLESVEWNGGMDYTGLLKYLNTGMTFAHAQYTCIAYYNCQTGTIISLVADSPTSIL